MGNVISKKVSMHRKVCVKDGMDEAAADSGEGLNWPKRTGDYLRFIGLVAIVWVILGCQSTERTYRPNVVMISIDDLNTMIGCMGAVDVYTPNIDRLAARGMLFTNAHCQAPLCGPSRASVMMGMRPSTTGIYGQIQDKDLAKVQAELGDIVLLPQYFRDHGYYTMGVGKIFHQHAPEGVLDESGGRVKGFGPKPPDGGFFVWNRKGTSTDWGAYPDQDSAMYDYQYTRWAVERLHREYPQPFFLAVGLTRPHVPWYVPQRWFDLYDTSLIQVPPYLETDMDDVPDIVHEIDDMPMYPTTDWARRSGEWKNIVRAYMACVSFVDHCVGQILNALEEGPHAENTIVVLWSDHGYRLGEKGTFAKQCLWNVATQVPMMISGPELPQNVSIDAPTELLSIYPTLLELCGLPPNPENEGRSLTPLMENEGTNWDYPAVTTYGKENHSIVSGNYRYIRYEDGSEELYDRVADPNEWYNLAKERRENHTILMEEMKSQLPAVNAGWSAYSSYSINDYFRRTSLKGKDH